MSGISPTENHTQYKMYQQNIQDLERDHEINKKREEESHERQLKSLRENQEKEIQALRNENEKTVDLIRNNQQDTLEKQRNAAQVEIDRQKQQTYDRYGKFNGLSAAEAQDAADQYKRAYETNEKRYDEKLSALDQYNREQRAELQKHQEQKLGSAIAAERRTLEHVMNNRDGSDQKLHTLQKEALEKKFQRIEDGALRNMDELQKQTKNQVQSAQNSEAYAKMKERESTEARLLKTNNDGSKKFEEATKTLNKARMEETNDLRGKIDGMSQYLREFPKGKSEGYRDAIKEHERDFNAEKWNMADRFAEEISNLKQHNADAEIHYSKLNQDAAQNKDRHFTNIIAKQNTESLKHEHDLSNTFERKLGELQTRMQKDRAQSQTAYEHGLSLSGEDKSKAILNQTRTFNENANRVREQYEGQIRDLQKALQNKRTASDPGDVHPAAEQKIRNALLNEDFKRQTADEQRVKEKVMSLQQDYSRRLAETVSDSKFKQTRIQQENKAESQADRSNFLMHIQDVEKNRLDSLNRQESDFSRQVERLQKGFVQELMHQRNQYTEIIQNLKLEQDTKLRTALNEAEHGKKMALRDMGQRHNEMARTYENQISMQKEEYELQLKDIKQKADLKFRELDQQSRRELEAQARMYEQRIEQLMAQAKERERFVGETYEDKIEKMKRSYALTQKYSAPKS